ncbi:ion transport peptide-like [Oppia nitens]|uniref:ion transport peptide-like n=1 Tax=Oppia nitens TaxID=1686743 RepID=UPI0023DB9532|nr:ion transport peptide-like [Oppia nitens]
MPSTQSPVPRKMMRRGKRSFASLKCLGAYDRSKFANLNHICDECYQLYRDQTIHVACREDCFRNDIFFGCVDALLLSHEHKSLKEMINHINGRK